MSTFAETIRKLSLTRTSTVGSKRIRYRAIRTFFIVRETNIAQSKLHQLVGKVYNNVYWTSTPPKIKHQTVSRWKKGSKYYDYEPVSRITRELLLLGYITDQS